MAAQGVDKNEILDAMCAIQGCEGQRVPLAYIHRLEGWTYPTLAVLYIRGSRGKLVYVSRHHVYSVGTYASPRSLAVEIERLGLEGKELIKWGFY